MNAQAVLNVNVVAVIRENLRQLIKNDLEYAYPGDCLDRNRAHTAIQSAKSRAEATLTLLDALKP